jgi:hypothetical protein
MPHQQLAKGLGAHEVVCHSILKTRFPNEPDKNIEQQVTLRMDPQRNFTVKKTTHPQFGFEAIWAGGWLYPRPRFSKFIKRRPLAGEPSAIADRMVGLLASYILLLKRFIQLENMGKVKFGDRTVVRVRLKLNPHPQPAPEADDGFAKGWRKTISVKNISGSALLDVQTGAPLNVDLDASWTFLPPVSGPLPVSGIPQKIDEKSVGTTLLRFRQRIGNIGSVAAISPPPQGEIAPYRRQRIEVERQMLLGERPLSSAESGSP